MMSALGQTRSRLAPRHALIAPDSHEAITLPDWPGATLVHLVTPDMGAGFSLFVVRSEGGLAVNQPAAGVERFVLLREGTAVLTLESGGKTLGPDDYAFLPAGCTHRIRADAPVQLLVLERPYTPREGVQPPAPHLASLGEVPSAALKGDTRLQVQKLLPQGPEWDMEINTMTFEPGASLPYVETHFMEHGLVMLDGGGIYRLEDDWYPVSAGDAIWMGPYCPQWFGAIGTGKARYLIYKNWNRDPLEKTQRI
ncbi:MAG: (S)-ureidoglycine aminohydrolase [Pararhodobacter sp.]